MAKIIKQADKFKPITCAFCGCVYEFEKGDELKTITMERMADATPIFISVGLECPFCGTVNNVEKENEE